MNEEEIRESLERFAVPVRLHDGIVRWIVSGIQPGSFLSAALANDLMFATCRASGLVIEELRTLMQWAFNEAPNDCWGSYEKMKAWAKQKSIENSAAAEPARRA